MRAIPLESPAAGAHVAGNRRSEINGRQVSDDTRIAAHGAAHRHRLRCNLSVVLYRQAATRARAGDIGAEGLHFSVHWNPFQLNPDMPKEGCDRTAYRAMKFGNAGARARIDERVAGRRRMWDLPFRLDLIRARRTRSMRTG